MTGWVHTLIVPPPPLPLASDHVPSSPPSICRPQHRTPSIALWRSSTFKGWLGKWIKENAELVLGHLHEALQMKVVEDNRERKITVLLSGSDPLMLEEGVKRVNNYRVR